MVYSIFHILISLFYLSVTVHSFLVDFGTAQQCGDVEVAWTRTSQHAEQFQFPFYLYILPFNSTAIIQPISNWNATTVSGSSLLNFDLPSNTPYLLGVTDAAGKGVGAASNIRNVLESNNTSCLSSLQSQAAPNNTFEAFSSPRTDACPSLTVSWQGTSEKAPRIIGFSPGRIPINLSNSTASSFGRNILTASRIYTSLSEVVVLLDDNVNTPRTSLFLLVGGIDRSSCLGDIAQSSSGSSGPLDTKTVIAIVFGFTGGTLLIVLLLVFYHKKRQRLYSTKPTPQFSIRTDRTTTLTTNVHRSMETFVERAVTLEHSPRLHGSPSHFVIPPEAFSAASHGNSFGMPKEEDDKASEIVQFTDTEIQESPTSIMTITNHEMVMHPPTSMPSSSIPASYNASTLSLSLETSESFNTSQEMTGTYSSSESLTPIPDSPTLPHIACPSLPRLSPFQKSTESLSKFPIFKPQRLGKSARYKKMDGDQEIPPVPPMPMVRRSRSLNPSNDSRSKAHRAASR